jgi:hypothetical protein
MRQMLLRRLHHITRRALRPFHFANRLLREDGSEIGLRHGSDMARRGKAEAIPEAERLPEAENSWFRKSHGLRCDLSEREFIEEKSGEPPSPLTQPVARDLL